MVDSWDRVWWDLVDGNDTGSEVMGKTLVKFKGKRVSKREVDARDKSLRLDVKDYKAEKSNLKGGRDA